MQAIIFAAYPRVQLSAFEVKNMEIPELCRRLSKTFPSGSSLKRISMLEVLVLIFGTIKNSTIKPKNISPSSVSHQWPAMKREDLPTNREDLLQWVQTVSFSASQFSFYATGSLKPIFFIALSSIIISLNKNIPRCWKCHFVHLLQKLNNILLKFRSIEENLV